MTTATRTTRLFNPAGYEGADLDPASARLMRATIDWFEAKGKARLTAEVHSDEWYGDFIEFLERERAFATLLTPARDAGATPTSAGTPRATRSSTRSSASTGCPTGTRGRSRSSASARSGRATTTSPACALPQLLEDGAVFAFGLSERDHGADIYSTDMILTPDGDGGFRASGEQVLHRQRQRGRAWCRCSGAAPTSRAPTATCSSRPTAPTRPTSWSRTSCTGRCTSARSTSRTTRSWPRMCCTRVSRRSRRRSTRSTSASSTSASARSAWPSTASTRR